MDFLRFAQTAWVSARPASTAAVVNAVDEHGVLGVEDLVNDTVVASAGRVEAFKVPEQRFSRLARVLGNQTENGLHGRPINLVWYTT